MFKEYFPLCRVRTNQYKKKSSKISPDQTLYLSLSCILKLFNVLGWDLAK